MTAIPPQNPGSGHEEEPDSPSKEESSPLHLINFKYDNVRGCIDIVNESMTEYEQALTDAPGTMAEKMAILGWKPIAPEKYPAIHNPPNEVERQIADVLSRVPQIQPNNLAELRTLVTGPGSPITETDIALMTLHREEMIRNIVHHENRGEDQPRTPEATQEILKNIGEVQERASETENARLKNEVCQNNNRILDLNKRIVELEEECVGYAKEKITRLEEDTKVYSVIVDALLDINTATKVVIAKLEECKPSKTKRPRLLAPTTTTTPKQIGYESCDCSTCNEKIWTPPQVNVIQLTPLIGNKRIFPRRDSHDWTLEQPPRDNDADYNRESPE